MSLKLSKEEWLTSLGLPSDPAARIAELEAFVRAYDAWRSAEDAAAVVEDGDDLDALRVLCEAEAKMQVELISAREALGTV